MKEDEFQKVKVFANTVLQECENKGLTNKEVEYFKEYLPKLIQINCQLIQFYELLQSMLPYKPEMEQIRLS